MISEGDSKKNYSDIALQYLREQIIDGNMQPGEKLIESNISEKLNLSRGPVRDALKQLAVEGLVDYHPNKGCTVALLSPRDAYEVFFLRGKGIFNRSGADFFVAHGDFAERIQRSPEERHPVPRLASRSLIGV